MSLIEELKALGADTDDALTRFMGNSALYEKMLRKLPKVINESPVIAFAQSGDYETATSNAHALKGVTGNLSLTPLYSNYTAIVDMYRGGDNEKAMELLTQTLEIQQKFVEVIEKYI